LSRKLGATRLQYGSNKVNDVSAPCCVSSPKQALTSTSEPFQREIHENISLIFLYFLWNFNYIIYTYFKFAGSISKLQAQIGSRVEY